MPPIPLIRFVLYFDLWPESKQMIFLHFCIGIMIYLLCAKIFWYLAHVGWTSRQCVVFHGWLPLTYLMNVTDLHPKPSLFNPLWHALLSSYNIYCYYFLIYHLYIKNWLDLHPYYFLNYQLAWPSWPYILFICSFFGAKDFRSFFQGQLLTDCHMHTLVHACI